MNQPFDPPPLPRAHYPRSPPRTFRHGLAGETFPGLGWETFTYPAQRPPGCLGKTEKATACAIPLRHVSPLTTPSPPLHQPPPPPHQPSPLAHHPHRPCTAPHRPSTNPHRPRTPCCTVPSPPHRAPPLLVLLHHTLMHDFRSTRHRPHLRRCCYTTLSCMISAAPLRIPSCLAYPLTHQTLTCQA